VLFKDETGTSIVEVTIAMVVFMIIMAGGLNYFTLPQSTAVREKIKGLAFAAAQQTPDKPPMPKRRFEPP